MLAWLVLLVLLVAEVVGIRWWLHKEYLPLFFSGWAALMYSAVLAVDFIIAWLLSTFEIAGGTPGTALFALLGVLLVVVVFLMTVFFRWVVSHDMSDIPK